MEADGGKTIFLLDEEGRASRGFTPDEIIARMSEMLGFQLCGENVYYTRRCLMKYSIEKIIWRFFSGR